MNAPTKKIGSCLLTMTAQQVYDKVAAHLMQQAAVSISANGACMYRSPQGHKCAAGCLIADDEYTSMIEGTNWNVLLHTGKVVDAHLSLVMQLQNVHDDAGPRRCGYLMSGDELRDYWRVRLEDVAYEYSLVPYKG